MESNPAFNQRWGLGNNEAWALLSVQPFLWVFDFFCVCSLSSKCLNFSQMFDVSLIVMIFNRWYPSWRHIVNVWVPQLHAADPPTHVLVLDSPDSCKRCSWFSKASASLLYPGDDCYTTCYTIVCFWLPEELHACRAQQGLVCKPVRIHGVSSCCSSSSALFRVSLLCPSEGLLVLMPL